MRMWPLGFDRTYNIGSLTGATLLVPLAWRLENMPQFIDCDDNGSGVLESIVLLPPKGSEKTVTGWTDSEMGKSVIAARRGSWMIDLVKRSYYHPIRIVAPRSFGVAFHLGREDIQAAVERFRGPDWGGYACHGGKLDVPKYSITFVPFIEWLDEQEQGSIFTLEEEAELREADRELTEHSAAEAQKLVGPPHSLREMQES